MLRSLAITLGLLLALPALADARPAVELKAQQEKTDQALAARERASGLAKDAAKARDKAASTVAKLKQKGLRGPDLETALQTALVRDEAAARARSTVAAADADVAREGARLLRLYDAVLAERRRAVDAAPAARRKELVESYRALVAQRDAVRKALAPVLAPSSEEGPVDQRGLDVGAEDDVETLLEKADLARDLEARLLRRADAVRRRIAELKDEASLEGDVAEAIARGQLFDEEDRRLVVTRSDLSSGKAVGLPGTNGTTPRSSDPAPQTGPVEQDASDGQNGPIIEVGVGTAPLPPAALSPPTATAERPVSLPTELQASTSSSSLKELQALETSLQKELSQLRAKKAALKKAAQDRSR